MIILIFLVYTYYKYIKKLNACLFSVDFLNEIYPRKKFIWVDCNFIFWRVIEKFIFGF